jgi:hypothetical protein
MSTQVRLSQLIQVKRVMAKFDQDGDGRLDFDEFQKYVILIMMLGLIPPFQVHRTKEEGPTWKCSIRSWQL